MGDCATETVTKLTYKEKLKFACAIAVPMASKSLCKKIYKLIKEASQDKTRVKIGIKDVQKALRKDENGILIIAADISPLDIVCHIPALCEEKDIPYCYTPSRADLGHAAGLFRSSIAILIKKHADYEEQYNSCLEEIKLLPLSV